jgi:hypothetical protein
MILQNIRLVPLWILFNFIGIQGVSAQDTTAVDTSSFEGDAVFRDTKFKERLYTGGESTAYFGTENLFLIAPILGYEIMENFSLGVGTRYMWYNSSVWNVNQHYFGVSVFARYQFLSALILHAELEKMNVEYYNPFEMKLKRKWIDIGLVGAGYMQPMGQRAWWQMLILYDVIQDKNSPYLLAFGIPIVIRTGFIIKFQ